MIQGRTDQDVQSLYEEDLEMAQEDFLEIFVHGIGAYMYLSKILCVEMCGLM